MLSADHAGIRDHASSAPNPVILSDHHARIQSYPYSRRDPGWGRPRLAVRAIGLIMIAAVFTMAVAGCESSQSVRVENKTENTVVVYEDGVATELVNPGATKEFSTQQFRGTLSYEIRQFCETETCDQSILAARTTTWEEITRTDGITIVIQ